MSENFNKITTSLAELETKIAFQDHTIEELNQALIKMIDLLPVMKQ